MIQSHFTKLICLILSVGLIVLSGACSSDNINGETAETDIESNRITDEAENKLNENTKTQNNQITSKKKEIVPIIYQEKTESYYYDITYTEFCSKIADVLEKLYKDNNIDFDRTSFLSGCSSSEHSNGAYYIDKYGNLKEPGDSGLKYNGTTCVYLVPFEYRNGVAVSEFYISVSPETLKIVSVELRVGDADLVNELDPEFMAFADMLANLFCGEDFEKLDKYSNAEYGEGNFGVHEFVCRNSFVKFKSQNTLNSTGALSLYIRPNGGENEYDKIDSEFEARILSLSEDKEILLVSVNGVVRQFSGIYVSASDFSPMDRADTMNYVRFYDDKIEMNIYLSTGFETVNATYKLSEDGKSIVLSECKNDSVLVFESGVEFVWPYEGDDISTIEISGSQDRFALEDEQLPSQFCDGETFFVFE